MEYEWDPKKAAANLAKHGVAFERVALFEWEDALIDEDLRYAYGERRFNAFGRIEGRLHTLVFTMRGRSVRMIGLRKANSREVRRYGKEKA
ncbi:BrnT family toxin [Bauldia litoralis]|uniref:Uncharacterized protein n=1 Tax=Bauldia litoralis TaxID=665467 RepID=A0A1G6BYH5_9HYPH|nr:BrnT family toxin [Bauldia litoralis]SDB25644.1 hypothetical protein SAMN02982931_02004 [Bauldia litoralis]